ncbi:alpha/beta-hydrolase [Gonapodya prolifera JEL478]|uniref:Alpha/beta-hydrolase n=1 Tax=Gonapodya prolifera (strain JEL478) TaxID=1344416 RepID=A0A139AY78_GONPJ|nr:alpha/beta-hydrolase [Gonapodya prolifera JEL478]|eukprot:KXS21702.1 alpha/beta-hydrolase [Gonapodya prolifera JEL478]
MAKFLHHSTKAPIVTVSGYGKIAYQDHSPTASAVAVSKDGKPLTILCVHGLLANSTLWSKMFPLFTSKGYRVVSPDLPLGSHLYPLSPDADVTPPGLGKLLCGFIEEANLENVVVLANDTGGAITQMMVTHHPTPRVKALALTDCDVYDYFLPPMFQPFLSVAAKFPGLYHLRLTNWLGMNHTMRYLPPLCGYLVKHREINNASDTILRRTFETGYNVPWECLRDVKRIVGAIDNKYTIDAAKNKFGGFPGKVLLAWCPEDQAFVDKFIPRLVEDFGGEGKVTAVQIHDSFTFSMLDQPEKLAEEVDKWAKANL